MKHAPIAAAGFEVQAKQCATCIYRSSCSLDLAALESAIADPRMAGFFVGYRACHHAPDRRAVCCRGFWDRHKDAFTMGQIAQRLKLVVFVTVDRFAKSKSRRRK